MSEDVRMILLTLVHSSRKIIQPKNNEKLEQDTPRNWMQRLRSRGAQKTNEKEFCSTSSKWWDFLTLYMLPWWLFTREFQTDIQVHLRKWFTTITTSLLLPSSYYSINGLPVIHEKLKKKNDKKKSHAKHSHTTSAHHHRKQQIFTRKTKKESGNKKVEQSNSKDTMRRNKSAYANSPVADFSVIYLSTHRGWEEGKRPKTYLNFEY